MMRTLRAWVRASSRCSRRPTCACWSPSRWMACMTLSGLPASPSWWPTPPKSTTCRHASSWSRSLSARRSDRRTCSTCRTSASSGTHRATTLPSRWTATPRPRSPPTPALSCSPSATRTSPWTSWSCPTRARRSSALLGSPRATALPWCMGMDHASLCLSTPCATRRTGWRHACLAPSPTRPATRCTGPLRASTSCWQASKASTANWSSSVWRTWRQWQLQSTSWPPTWTGTLPVATSLPQSPASTKWRMGSTCGPSRASCCTSNHESDCSNSAGGRVCLVCCHQSETRRSSRTSSSTAKGTTRRTRHCSCRQTLMCCKSASAWQTSGRPSATSGRSMWLCWMASRAACTVLGTRRSLSTLRPSLWSR
mmetsp:Transcript_22784/g.62979  ORF Transcript_22784/g.62979 Transcript_22784/m.62979 type:complete len:368 (+) Transcript_22784:1144-2247(+)